MKPVTRAWLGSLLLLSPSAIAGTVYTWTDANGTTHFSEAPPSDIAIEARQIEVDTPPAIQSPLNDDYFSILNQARRMQDSRLEREKVRTERLRAEAEARQAAAAAQAANRRYDDVDYGNRYYGPLWGAPYWRGHRPGHRPGRPGHLPGRPGHRPSRPSHKPSRPVVGIPGRR